MYLLDMSTERSAKNSNIAVSIPVVYKNIIGHSLKWVDASSIIWVVEW